MRPRHVKQVLAGVVGAVALAAPLALAPAGAGAAVRKVNLAKSVSVGYFYDDGVTVGVNSGIPNLWSHFVTPNLTSTGTTTADYKSQFGSVNTVYHFTDVTLTTVDGSSTNPFLAFDTLISFEVCGIGDATKHPKAMPYLNAFLQAGKKALIYDADLCNAGTVPSTQPDYSKFLFPFTTNNPGPQGAPGPITSFEPSQLTAGYTTGQQDPSTQIGDANIFTSFVGAWCVAVRGTNINNVTGPIEAYARASSGANTGLAIYDGEDNYLSGANDHHQLVLDNALAQSFNPDSLPCTGAASGVGLQPSSVTQGTGQPQQVVASITDQAGNPVGGVPVTFTVTNTKPASFTPQTAPNNGVTSTVYSSCSGNAVFVLSSTTAGTDFVTATFKDAGGNVHSSSTATVTWAVGAPTVPPTLAEGYYLDATDGGIFSYGPPAVFQGSHGGSPLNKPINGMAACGSSYYLVASDGGIFTYGPRAVFQGSHGGSPLNQPVVGMTLTPDGGGYYLVASDGGIFTYGNAAFAGSTGAIHLNQPIVGMAANPAGGYWLVASDGRIFAFGTPFLGSHGGSPLNKPIVGMAATPTGKGYWLVASDGGIFTYGDAAFFGSTGAITLNKPIVGMASSPSGQGYWLDASDGGIFAFGDSQFKGSAGGTPLNQPVVGMASAS